MSVAKRLLFEQMDDERPKIVRRFPSRTGGYCQHPVCGRWIHPGETAVKVWDGLPGHQTAGGQGPGKWWCEPCATTYATD